MLKYFFFFLIAFGVAPLLTAQTFEQVDYVPIDDVIGNPERGFYHQLNSISEEALQDFKTNGVRLILVNYSLKGYHNQPLPASFLQSLRTDFEKVRNAGFKIILRFAYSFSGTDPVPDATLDFVLLHISQLRDILRENSDVILTLQAGFIGTWGEWWNTENFSQYPGLITEENWVDRRMVADALLEAIPADRMIQLRTPDYKRNLLQETDFIPVTEATAFDGSERSRLAHHNDCFVSGNFDVGTYHDTILEKPYLALDSKYTIVGGETCNPNAQSSCENSLTELQRFHWTFLNLDYHQGIISQWHEEGCYDEIEKRLGYRYELLDANLQNSAKPGGEVQFSVRIKNVGWANPMNPYNLKLVLQNISTNKSYVFDIDEDVRLWTLGEPIDVNVTAGLPSEMESGDYSLFLAMTDGRLSLGFNPDYCIRMANDGVWDETLGYNDLLHLLTVEDNANLPDYSGGDFFLEEDAITAGFEAPKALKITQYNDNNIIYWSMGEAESLEKVVRLQRSIDGDDFQTLTVKSLKNIFYIDKNLQDNTNYTYRVQFIRENQYSETNEKTILKQNAPLRQFLNIQMDGDAQDWNIVPPVITGYQQGMVALKMANDAQNLHFYLEAPEVDDFQLHLNTDNGEQYEIHNDSLYRINDVQQLVFQQLLTLDYEDGFLEGSVSLSDIDFLNPGLTCRLSLNGVTIGLPDTEFPFLKYPVLDVPASFKVVPSVSTPLSKVKISWLYNSGVEGYIIERSEGDNEHFEVIRDIGGSNNYYLNDNLDSATRYYYRMYSYSGIVRSPYTDEFDIRLDAVPVDEVQKALSDIHIYPNPAKEAFYIRLNTGVRLPVGIQIYNSNGKQLRTLYEGVVQGNKTIVVQTEGLSPGLYFIRIQSEFQTITRKITIF